MKSVEIHNLSKKYPKVKRYREILLHPFRRDYIQALDSISISVEKGVMLGLLGPNGAGKTTLIKILATLVSPTSGAITVNGHDITKDSLAVRRNIGFVTADERSFYWRLTGRQNLAFFACLNNMPPSEMKERIAEILDHTELADVGDTMFKNYSTGMKQRLAIARGLLCNPDILLLDEPTRSLDPYSAQKLRTFIMENIIQRLGRTAIMATHNLHEAHDMCSHLAIMKHGRMIVHGPKNEVMQGAYTDSYQITLSPTSGEIPFGAMPLITGHRVLDASTRTFSILTDDIESVLRGFYQHDVSIVECSKQRMSLDDFFIALVKNDGA